MILRFIRLAVLRKRLAEEIFGVGIFRVDFQRLFILKDRFPQPMAAMETDSQIIMRQRTGRFPSDHVAIMVNRFLEALGFQESVGKICSDVRIRVVTDLLPK